MQAETSKRYQGKKIDLDLLATKIITYLKNENLEVQSSSSTSDGIAIQGKRKGIQGFLEAGRSLTVIITGQPDDFVMRFGVGIWRHNLSVGTAENLSALDSLQAGVHPSTFRFISLGEQVMREVDDFVNGSNGKFSKEL